MASIAQTMAQIHAPELPWNITKPEDLGPAIMQHVAEHEPFFRWWAQTWFENFQFLFGNHNMRWSRRYGFALDYDVMRQNQAQSTLKSQTNISRVVVEALASLIYSNMPEWEVEAMEDSAAKGKRFQRICEKLLDCFGTRLAMDKEYAIAAVQFVLFGQFAWKVDWDHNAGQTLQIPKWRKVQKPTFSTYMAPNMPTGGLLEVPTPITGPDGQPQMRDQWEAVVDQMGQQIVDTILSGDPLVRTLTPLQYRRQIGSPGMHRTRWVQDFELLDYDEFMERYEDVPGATKAFKNVRPVFNDPAIYAFATRHFLRMQFTTPPTLDDVGRRANSVFKTAMFKYKVLVVNHYDCPSRHKWEKGRRVVVVNGEVTHMSDPSYCVPGKLGGWHPYVEAQWLNVAPSSIAAGPMNDVTRKNRELNVKDTLISTAVRRNMGSALIVSTSSGLDPDKFTGEPGQTHKANDINGARYLHDEMPIPPVMAQLRQQDKDDVYDTSGAGDALRGQPSTGASSGYQEKQREEREEKRLAPPRKAFEQAVAELGEKLIFCIKSNVIKLDDNVMGYMKRAGSGEFSSQDVLAFLSTPFNFGTEIRVKKSSMALKSKATQQATLQELAGGALAGRLQQDAKVLDKYLKFFDADVLRDSSGPHRDRVERENEAFLDLLRLGPDAQGIMKPVVMFEDDDDIHADGHAEFAITHAEELLASQWLLNEFLAHEEQHRLQKQEKMGQLMPGTALQTATMMGQAEAQPTPTVQAIAQNTMMKQQQAAQQPKGQSQPQPAPAPAPAPQGGPPASTGGGQAPQAPKVGGKTDPAAPSGNTPKAMARGGFQ